MSAGAPVKAGRICWLPGEAGGEGAGGWRPWPMPAALSPLTTVGTGGVDVRLIVVLPAPVALHACRRICPSAVSRSTHRKTSLSVLTENLS